MPPYNASSATTLERVIRKTCVPMRATLAGGMRKINRQSLADRLNPDIPMDKVWQLLACVAIELVCIVAKMSLRFYAIKNASSDSVVSMLTVDTIKYTAMLVRNILIFRWVVAHHSQLANKAAFTTKNMIHDSTLGRQSEVCVEVFMLFALGAVFQAMAFSQLVEPSPASNSTSTSTSTSTHPGYGASAAGGLVYISQISEHNNAQFSLSDSDLWNVALNCGMEWSDIMRASTRCSPIRQLLLAGGPLCADGQRT